MLPLNFFYRVKLWIKKIRPARRVYVHWGKWSQRGILSKCTIYTPEDIRISLLLPTKKSTLLFSCKHTTIYIVRYIQKFPPSLLPNIQHLPSSIETNDTYPAILDGAFLLARNFTCFIYHGKLVLLEKKANVLSPFVLNWCRTSYFSILPLHCTIRLEGGVATLLPAPDSLCLVNASPVDAPVRLSQGCVIVLGRCSGLPYFSIKYRGKQGWKKTLFFWVWVFWGEAGEGVDGIIYWGMLKSQSGSTSSNGILRCSLWILKKIK